MEQFLLPIDAVFLPTLSRLQSQPERYRSTFLRLYEAVAMSAFFFSSLLLALATPVTLVLLGPKWDAVSAIFAGFTFTAIQLPLSTAANWLLTSQGRGKDIFRVTSINAFLTLASFIIGLPFGPLGVAIAFLGYRSPGSAANFILCRRTARSSNHLRFVDEILAASASLGGYVCRDLVDARHGRGFASADSITHLRASWSPYRDCLHLHVSAAAKSGNRSIRHCTGI